MPQPVLVACARTPIGKLLGALAALPATALGGVAIEAALARAGIAGGQVDAVLAVRRRRLGRRPHHPRLGGRGSGAGDIEGIAQPAED